MATQEELDKYWNAICETCKHIRAHHGEGGCAASRLGILGNKQCGCHISQLSYTFKSPK